MTGPRLHPVRLTFALAVAMATGSVTLTTAGVDLAGAAVSLVDGLRVSAEAERL